MTTSPTAPTRRERQRRQTVDEIKGEALRALDDGSVEDVTLSAIARAMGMSVAGLYRYFASREELLVTLAGDSYGELADALEKALDASKPGRRRAAVARAYRQWAIERPGRYRLVFSSIWGSGLVEPETALPSAHRAMAVIVTAVQDDPGPAPRLRPRLTGQLQRWARRAEQPVTDPELLRRAVAFWSSLHGLVSLELEGVWTAMDLDAALLVDTDPSVAGA